MALQASCYPYRAEVSPGQKVSDKLAFAAWDHELYHVPNDVLYRHSRHQVNAVRSIFQKICFTDKQPIARSQLYHDGFHAHEPRGTLLNTKGRIRS